MSATEELIITDNRGRSEGYRFSDSPPFGDIRDSTIRKILLRKNRSCIFSLTIYYSWNNGEAITHGYATSGASDVTETAEFTLEPDEFITSIEGKAARLWVIQLTFVTTKHRFGPFGGDTGDSFQWAPVGENLRLLAFSGYAGEYLRGIQATFGRPYHDQEVRVNSIKKTEPLKTVRYDCEAAVAPTTNVSSGIGYRITRSKYGWYVRCAQVTQVPEDLIFAGACSHLMSPIATLRVGEGKVQFHAHEDTLCKLPFFNAALQGMFKEATEKTISMPVDDPTHVSALLEFLYMGSYTYTYYPASVMVPEGSTTPAGDLNEGLYHLGVYVVAAKYDASVLALIALKNFKAVAIELESICALQLWLAAYTEDLRLPRCRQEFDQYSSGQGLVSWVQGLFREHEEVMEGVLEQCPLLTADLLRISTGDA